jgi:hypothetical protein
MRTQQLLVELTEPQRREEDRRRAEDAAKDEVEQRARMQHARAASEAKKKQRRRKREAQRSQDSHRTKPHRTAPNRNYAPSPVVNRSTGMPFDGWSALCEPPGQQCFAALGSASGVSQIWRGIDVV